MEKQLNIFSYQHLWLFNPKEVQGLLLQLAKLKDVIISMEEWISMNAWVHEGMTARQWQWIVIFPDLDVLGDGELAWDGALVRLGGSVDDDLLGGRHVGRDQDARVHLRILFNLLIRPDRYRYERKWNWNFKTFLITFNQSHFVLM